MPPHVYVRAEVQREVSNICPQAQYKCHHQVRSMPEVPFDSIPTFGVGDTVHFNRIS